MSEIEEFIKRRFPNNSNWMDRNDFQFAAILKSCFSGVIVFDPNEKHFLFHNYIDQNYYDYSGKRNYTEEEILEFLDWKTLPQNDVMLYKELLRNYVL